MLGTDEEPATVDVINLQTSWVKIYRSDLCGEIAFNALIRIVYTMQNSSGSQFRMDKIFLVLTGTSSKQI